MVVGILNERIVGIGVPLIFWKREGLRGEGEALP
jgi:hypothetical protein